MITKDANAMFVERMANPHSWLLTADNLHEQAIALYGRTGRASITLIDRDRSRTTWDSVNRSVFLLGGFALENAIKAFLVYEHPGWISNGVLSKKLRSHSLTDLQKQSALVPFKRQYLWVLKQFEDELESWARYPCALTASETVHERKLSPRLWSGYLRVMEAYGASLKKLLSKEWKGPNGFIGRWTFSGDFLTGDTRY